jgi:uncharacterized membrane protein YhaH (DUF805 family)
MDWKYLLTSFDGRIGRQSWWLGTIAMIILSLILYFILSAVLGTGMTAMMADPQKMLEPGYMDGVMRMAAIQQLITIAIIGFPATALMAKRLNDRNRPTWLKWLFWLPTVVSIVLSLLGLAYTTTDMGSGVMMPTPTSLMTIVSFAALALGIWALVELGILRGTAGPNQFGEDPIAT